MEGESGVKTSFSNWEKYEPYLRGLCKVVYERYNWNIESYEDLYQTACYLLLIALNDFDGRGDEAGYVKQYVRRKLFNMLKNGENAPKHNDHPFSFVRQRRQKVQFVLCEEDILELYQF